MHLYELYHIKYAAAYVRGVAIQSNNNLLPSALIQKNLYELTAEETEEIIEKGKAAGLKLYCFKNSHNDLPRVKRILGFLRSIEMNNLLDAGSGRGVFLWSCLNAFPWIEVTSIDLLPHRVEMLNTVRQGGVTTLNAVVGDICSLETLYKSYDVVTLLEVLEHIPKPLAAIQSAVRIAKKFVAVSVPSKPDNNPEHIHLLTKDILTDFFNQAGCTRLHFDSVPGHLIMIAALEV